MRIFAYLSVGCLLYSLYANAQLPAVVKVSSGQLTGTDVGGIRVYKGIPYAAPPVGNLRWRAPFPTSPWKGILKADTFRLPCLQPKITQDSGPSSEDCLYLNIWSAAQSSAEKLPVMMWIHGGGFTIGSASAPSYWGDQLAKKGVVVVTIAYRLGALGFLAHPAFTAESDWHGSGNYGLMDMIAGLRWVQENIQAFGGDPSRVTLFGQSAGSRAVSLLMISPQARGLFHRVIGQSGASFRPAGKTDYALRKLDTAEQEGKEFVDGFGKLSIQQLRKLPPEKLLLAPDHLSRPIIDGHVIENDMYSEFANGRQIDVPILVGYNADESVNLKPPSIGAVEFKEQFLKQFGAEYGKVIQLYPANSDQEADISQRNFVRDTWFGWDMWTWARLQSKTGKSKAYAYFFSHVPPYPSTPYYWGWGAAHGAELPYVFLHVGGSTGWEWTNVDRDLANLMSTYWTNFAKTGDPNQTGLPQWPNYSEDNPAAMYFKSISGAEAMPNLAALKFLDKEMIGSKN